jgi:MIP family channel proteins
VSGGVSGAHLNPAVSTTMALFNKFEWSKVLPYSIAQVLGSFLGALMVNIIYYNAINEIDPEHTLSTASIFATYPQPFVTTGSAFLTEMFASALLLGGIFAFSDERNNPSKNAPASVGLLVCGLGMSFGWPTGYALNPARDLGPRIMTSIFGWGSLVFTSHNYYFWIPIVAPVVGGAVGGGAYTLLIKYHHPPQANLKASTKS